MSSRDKEHKSLQDKFKQFFKRNPPMRGRGSFELTEDLQRDIGRETPPQQRIKRLKELNERILSSNLDTNTIAKLWTCIEDIFQMDNIELRNTAFVLLRSLMKHQSEELQVTRSLFFRFIKTHNNPQDIGQRLQLLIALTNNGKNVLHFEEEMGPFLLSWFPDIQRLGKMAEFLDLILNTIKFNAFCLESSVLAELVEFISILCCGTYEEKIIDYCLRIMETVIAYSNLPADSLPRLIGTLCRTVNSEEYCALSWKVGKNLLGTHMGHSALYTLCMILKEPALKSESLLFRGAVFFIHMSLWSSQSVGNLCCPVSSVLPSFLEAVKTDNPVICFEVIVGIQALIQKQGADLQHGAWCVIIEILHHVNNSVEKNAGEAASSFIVTPFHDTLSTVEYMIDAATFNGSVEQFYELIEACAGTRPERSVLGLINYLSRDIICTEHSWLSNLNNLLNKYFKPEDVRTNIRLAALEVLSRVTLLNRRNYEEELIERIVVPHCLHIINDPNITVRSAAAKMLTTLCTTCETKRCVEMLDILEKMMFRPFDVFADQSPSEAELSDLSNLIRGMIDVFVYKMERLPSSHAIKIYRMLVLFVETHYKKPKVFANCHHIRYIIFNCFLRMRADEQYHLGYLKDDSTIHFSPYLCVVSHSKERTGGFNSPLPQSPAIAQHSAQCNITCVSIKRAFGIFITCLKQEKDWNVLRLVLHELPKVMKNKPLILSKYGNVELDVLVDVVSPTILDKYVLPESFPQKLTKQEYTTAFMMVLLTLPSYHACLDQKHQQYLVRCLSRCIANSLRMHPKQLIEALTICCLEMRDVMLKMLPEILLTISKISPTNVIAIPVLEFLSTLTQLPMVYASFVDDQYMAVFAITSPFTNPFKFNHYTVSLAHFVIGVWFLKCRLPIRRNFVKFITNGLQTNVLTPFEETTRHTRLDLSKLNKDSSDRKRSSSLTEQGPRRRAATVSGGTGSADVSGTQDGKLTKISIPLPISLTAANPSLLTFYEELTETCIDLMARYAFSPCSALPRRTPTAEFILNGGQSMSWLLGNKMITITTSGCSQKVLKHGLCDKCWNICSNENQMRRSSTSDASADTDRYEKPVCACWCQSWAEIFVRRPTGDMSWVMRIQNTVSSKSLINEFPLKEITNLFMPSVATSVENNASRTNSTERTVSEESNQNRDEQIVSVPISIPSSPARNSPSRQSSRDSFDEDNEYIYDDGARSRNPVRRSNSSPEMSNWKNPFAHVKHEDDKGMDDDGGKKGKLYSKDMRVSCEAIPEEMGTTPPSNEAVSPKDNLTTIPQIAHPSLLSCHSYPGSSPPKDSNIPPKPYKTVPPTPNVLTTMPQPSFPVRGALSKNSSSDLSDQDADRSNNPSAFSKLQQVSTKPPQSPTQTLRLWSTKDREGNEIQKSASASVLDKNTSSSGVQDKTKDRKSTGSIDKLGDFDPQKRDRTHTVAGTSPGIRRPRSEQLKQINTRPREAPKSGINPSFVFLQLYQRVDFADCKEKPLLVDSDDTTRRAVTVLDRIPPYETHKVGVLYIRDGQVDKESEILKNAFGSVRYAKFLGSLGTLFKLQDVDPQLFFLGGLSQSGEDGKFSYIWQDDLVKMIFHIATLMPNKESDPNCNDKKLHIGNNNVTIVYNESEDEYNINTIKSQYNFASVIIHPMDHNLNKVTVKCKQELISLMGEGCQETRIVSDQSVAILARQLALHANLASLVHQSLNSNSQNPYASNWLERLRQIKKIRNRLVEKIESVSSVDKIKTSTKPRQRQMEDFTEYT